MNVIIIIGILKAILKNSKRLQELKPSKWQQGFVMDSSLEWKIVEPSLKSN